MSESFALPGGSVECGQTPTPPPNLQDDDNRRPGETVNGNLVYYTPREERLNTLTHAIGVPIALVLLLMLIVKANGRLWPTMSGLIFGMGMVVTFVVSTAYHSAKNAVIKGRLRILDHSCVYLMIASFHTPYMLMTLRDRGGLVMAIAIWALAVSGCLIEFLWVNRPKWLIGAIYVAMGWGIMLKGVDLYELLPSPGFALLLAGGITCTLGVAFYVQKNREFMHAVFHLFILAAMVPTWLAIYGYVID